MGGRGPKDQLGTRRRHSWAWHGSPQLTGPCLRPANCELWMQGQVVLRPWPQRCCPAERLLPEHCQDLARTADRAVLPGVGQNSRKEDKGQRRSITPECPPPALGSTSERGKRVQTSTPCLPLRPRLPSCRPERQPETQEGLFVLDYRSWDLLGLQGCD